MRRECIEITRNDDILPDLQTSRVYRRSSGFPEKSRRLRRRLVRRVQRATCHAIPYLRISANQLFQPHPSISPTSTFKFYFYFHFYFFSTSTSTSASTFYLRISANQLCRPPTSCTLSPTFSRGFFPNRFLRYRAFTGVPDVVGGWVGGQVESG